MKENHTGLVLLCAIAEFALLLLPLPVRAPRPGTRLVRRAGSRAGTHWRAAEQTSFAR
jgi:hypothetical protein